MKKYVLLGVMTLALAGTNPALSQTAPASPGGPPSPSIGQGGGQWQHQGGPNGEGGNEQERQEHFQEHKAEILKRMNEHLAEVQQRIGCVQAATNHEALRACMPERRGGEERGPEGRGGER